MIKAWHFSDFHWSWSKSRTFSWTLFQYREDSLALRYSDLIKAQMYSLAKQLFLISVVNDTICWSPVCSLCHAFSVPLYIGWFSCLQFLSLLIMFQLLFPGVACPCVNVFLMQLAFQLTWCCIVLVVLIFLTCPVSLWSEVLRCCLLFWRCLSISTFSICFGFLRFRKDINRVNKLRLQRINVYMCVFGTVFHKFNQKIVARH